MPNRVTDQRRSRRERIYHKRSQRPVNINNVKNTWLKTSGVEPWLILNNSPAILLHLPYKWSIHLIASELLLRCR